MAIGTPVQLGSTTAAAGATTLVLTTTANAPAGSLIVAFATGNNAVNLNTCADSAGNTYSAGPLFSDGVGKQRAFWTLNAIALPSGGTITATWATTTGVKLMGAVSVTGCAAADLKGAGALGTSTAPSLATGTLGWPNEIVFGMTQVTAGSADTFTEATGFTANTPALNTDALRWAWQIVTARAAVTYAPTLGTSRTWGVNTLTFSGAVPSPFNQTSRFSYLEM